MCVEIKGSSIVATQDAAKGTLLFKVPGNRLQFDFESYFGFGEKKSDIKDLLAVKDEKVGLVIFEPDGNVELVKNLKEKEPNFFFPRIIPPILKNLKEKTN